MPDRSPPRGLITYDGLPISAGGAHRIRKKDRAAIWESMRQFLHSFTTNEEPDEVRLLLHEGPRVDEAFFEDAHRLATAAFGRPRRRLAIAGAEQEHEHCWMVEPRDIHAAVQ